LNGAVYLVQDLHLGGEAVVGLAVPTGAAIDRGEIWRPLTSLVVHPGGPVHLGINTVLLAAVGAHAERELNRNQIIATYLGGGFAANAARYALGGRTGGGASAAIFAVAGAALASRLHRSGRAREADVAAFALIAGGSIIAATASDNHLLALGLGGVMGRAAAKPSGDRRFMQMVGAVTVAALIAMVGRSHSS
jgi:membrane associated rhomboid family serine protease